MSHAEMKYAYKGTKFSPILALQTEKLSKNRRKTEKVA